MHGLTGTMMEDGVLSHTKLFYLLYIVNIKHLLFHAASSRLMEEVIPCWQAVDAFSFEARFYQAN